MNTQSDQARLIAERIARRVSENPSAPIVGGNGSAADISSELAAMRVSLGELQNRLVQIESKVRAGSADPGHSDPRKTVKAVPLTHSPWLAGVNAGIAHPSQDRFGVEEATVSELVDYFQNEKICSVEPGGKPCDHCAMCSSRGF
jgi:hypothetical protein